jgi:hypothetical protein
VKIFSQYEQLFTFTPTGASILIGIKGVVVEDHEEERRRRTPSSERGSGMNEVSFRARPHHNVHSTLGVDEDHDSTLTYNYIIL